MNAEHPTSLALPPRLAAYVQDVFGARPVAARRVSHQGCTPTERFVVALPDGQTAFVKAAVNERTAGDLRREHLIYSQVSGPFMPQFLGWRGDGQLPILLIENLEDAFWPPPWSSEHIAAVRRTLAQVASTPAPPGLPSLETMRDALSGWRRVADVPAPFLGLQLCSARWLEAALPIFLAASTPPCWKATRCCTLMSAATTCASETGKLFSLIEPRGARQRAGGCGGLAAQPARCGPAPGEVVGDEAADIAALLAGYWASRAGLPPVPDAPRVRPCSCANCASRCPGPHARSACRWME